MDDLVALVAGSRNKYSLAGARQRTTHAVHSLGERRGNKTGALERPAPVQRSERMKQATPEQNIPLEDDFNDF